MAALTAKAVSTEHELGMNNGYWVQSKNLILERKVSRCVEEKELGVAEQVVSDFNGFSYQLQEGAGATTLSVTVSMPYLG